MKRAADMKTASSNEGSAVRYAWFGWAALFFVMAAFIVAGSGRTVVPAYREGALSWLAGEIIYKDPGVGGFVYLPQAAILFIPFSLLPVLAGEVLWRLVNIGVFALGIRGLARLAGEQPGKELFPLITLATLPLAWDCARNGQATLALTGLMLLAVVDVARSRWWRATLWLSLGVAVKPLAIVLVLLIMAIYRPMTWRVLLGIAAVALAPFAAQHPAYVLQQYSAFLYSTTKAAHVGVVASGWSSPFSALRLAGVDVPEHVQTALRLAAAIATLALCFLATRRHDAARSAIFVFSLAVVYLMLFSPRTESNTYAMLGPVIGVFLAWAFLIKNRAREGILLGGIAAILLGSRLLERLFTPHADTSWVSPLMAACFAVYLLVRLFSDPAELTRGKGEA